MACSTVLQAFVINCRCQSDVFSPVILMVTDLSYWFAIGVYNAHFNLQTGCIDIQVLLHIRQHAHYPHYVHIAPIGCLASRESSPVPTGLRPHSKKQRRACRSINMIEDCVVWPIVHLCCPPASMFSRSLATWFIPLMCTLCYNLIFAALSIECEKISLAAQC